MSASTPTREGGAGITTAARRGRRLLWPALFVALLVLVGVAAALTPRDDGLPADPGGTGPLGAQAVARVLTEREQVRVEPARTTFELQQARVDRDTTLLVVSSDQLSERAADIVRTQATRAGRLVLIAPDDAVLERLGVPAQVADADTDDRGSCSSDDVGDTDELPRGSNAYEVEPGVPAQGCFPTLPEEDDLTAAAPRALPTGVAADAAAGAQVEIAARNNRPYTVLVGAADLLANADIASRDNAGIALRTLSHHSRIVWVVPAPDETPVAAGNSPVPPWLVPGTFVLALAGLALCLWRGRRLGRLVTEPLPAVIHAIETTRARGRLYRQAKSPDRAWAVVRDAVAGRLRGHLALGFEVPLEHVSAAAAEATGRPRAEIRDLLTHAPTDDAELAHAITELQRLDREVHIA